MSIAPKNETAWYRIYWACMALGCLGALYWVVKWAVMAAVMELSMR